MEAPTMKTTAQVLETKNAEYPNAHLYKTKGNEKDLREKGENSGTLTQVREADSNTKAGQTAIVEQGYVFDKPEAEEGTAENVEIWRFGRIISKRIKRSKNIKGQCALYNVLGGKIRGRKCNVFLRD